MSSVSAIAGEQRSSAREDVHIETSFTRTDAHGAGHAVAVAAVIRNVSLTGLLVSTDAPLRLLETITVALPVVGPRAARVARGDGDRHGCVFLPALTMAEYAAMLGRVPIDRVDADPGDVDPAGADPRRSVPPLSFGLNRYGALVRTGVRSPPSRPRPRRNPE